MHTNVEKKNVHELDSNMQDIEWNYYLTFTLPEIRRTKRPPLSPALKFKKGTKINHTNIEICNIYTENLPRALREVTEAKVFIVLSKNYCKT